jgi:hypothetical protein
VSERPSESFVGPRARPWIVVALGISLALVVFAMGVTAPGAEPPPLPDLRDRIVDDVRRLRAAVTEYSLDTGRFPPAVFDLSEGYDGGLSHVETAPFRVQDAWNGPYLPARMERPTPASFWSLTEQRRELDRDGDGLADEAWARLHRGHGEIDATLAAWCDEVLDDGVPDTGCVRVTPAWVWFHLTER